MVTILGSWLPSSAMAAWPVDGTPVAVAASEKRIRTVVADGEAAIFVAWEEYTASPARIRVQRLLSGGGLAAGWPAAGLLPAASSRRQADPFVVPDGLGGCFIAWWDEYDNWYNGGVYLQHILPSGLRDPGWPSAGILIAEGYFAPSGLGQEVDLLGLVPNAAGGCMAIVLTMPYGCHDGLCGSGGYVYLHRLNAVGGMVSAVRIAECRPTAPSVRAIWDGADGVLALIQAACFPAEGTGFRHVRLGDEPFVPLSGYTNPRSSQLEVVADGTVLLGRHNFTGGSFGFPVVHHLTPDGNPASGAPAGGRSFPTTPQWGLAVDAGGTSFLVWRPTESPATIRGLKLEADLATSSGWDPAGIPWVSVPAVVDRFATVRDGNGGAYVVWSDLRNGGSDRDVYASRLAPDGQVVPAPSSGGIPLSMAPGLQTAPHAVAIGTGRAIAVWQDSRSGVGVDLYAQRVAIDLPVPARVSVTRLEATSEYALIEWQLEADPSEVLVERTRGGDSWEPCARILPGSLRRVRYQDRDVRAGEAWGYRIAFTGPDGPVRSEVVWATIPSARLGVRVLGSTDAVQAEVEVSLASDHPARLELVDLAGRRLRVLEIHGLAAGTHRVTFGLHDLASGVAWLALRQHGASAVTRIPIVR